MTFNNFDFIIERNTKSRDQGYESGHHSENSILRHLFGQDLDQEMSLDQFTNFHARLTEEVLKLEYVLLSDGTDDEGEPFMSLYGFALSVINTLPANYRKEYLHRLMHLKEVCPAAFLHEQAQIESNSEVIITFDMFKTWKEVIKILPEMKRAVEQYSNPEGELSFFNMIRAARGVGGMDLSYAQVWILFELFDGDKKGRTPNFNKLLKNNPHNKSPDGLGVVLLAGCVKDKCRDCATAWYDGTLE